MPMSIEHSARLKAPGGFDPDSFRRTKGGTIHGSVKVPTSVGIIWAKLKGHSAPSDPPIPQALRFPKSTWTVEKAKSWLSSHNVKYISFEPGKKEASRMKIENFTKSVLEEVSDKDLFAFRLRFIQMWSKEFRVNKRNAQVAGLRRCEFLDRYKILLDEIKSRKLVIKRKSSIDWALFRKTMIGMEVSSMGEVVMIPDYVTVSGDFVKNPCKATLLDVVIRDSHLRGDIERKVKKMFNQQVALPLEFLYQPAGPHSSFIPVFDLVLRAKTKTGRVEHPDTLMADDLYKYYYHLDEWDSVSIIDGAAVLNTIAEFNPMSVLDVGCGSGRVLKMLEDGLNCEVHGIDNNIVAVQMAKSKDLPISLGFMKKLAFKDNEFDVVFSTHALEYSSNLEQTVSEMLRVAKKAVVAVVALGEEKSGAKHQTFDKESAKSLFGSGSEFSTLLNGNGLVVLEKKEGRVKKKKKQKKEVHTAFKVLKSNEHEHIIGGIVYAPNEIDAHGDFATVGAITEAMQTFMEGRRTINIEHDQPIDCRIIECFQADADTEKEGGIIPAGAWWLTLRVNDQEIWNMLVDGELTGFSFGGVAAS